MPFNSLSPGKPGVSQPVQLNHTQISEIPLEVSTGLNHCPTNSTEALE